MKSKLLWITYTLPYFPGGGAQTRQYFLLKEAAKHFDIFLVSTANPEELERLNSLKLFCRDLIVKVNAIKSRTWHILKSDITRLCNTHSFDFILLDQSDIAHWADRLPHQKCAIGVNAHNVNSALWCRIARNQVNWWRKVVFYFKALKDFCSDWLYLSKVNVVFACSQKDVSLFKRINSRINAVVIPNGVDTDYFASQIESVNLHHAVFTGSLIYQPNAEACHWFIRNVMPKLSAIDPKFIFNVVGLQPPDSLLNCKSKDVRIFPNVPDVRPYIQESAFFVVPLHSGSGTRLKILEAMAMEKVVITTALGAEGLEGLCHMKNIIFAETPEEFISHISTLQQSPQRISEIGKNARLQARSRYEWSNLGSQFIQEIEKCI